MVDPVGSDQLFHPPKVSKTITFIYQEPYKDALFLRQKYVVERASIKEIAAEIFSSPSTVHKYLRKFDIPLRAVDDKNRNRLAFGEAWRARRVASHKRELEAIGKMRKLRGQGFSYWKIADVLNSWAVPTKTRRGKWHARSVQQILERHLEDQETAAAAES